MYYQNEFSLPSLFTAFSTKQTKPCCWSANCTASSKVVNHYDYLISCHYPKNQIRNLNRWYSMHQLSIGCLTSHIHLNKINPFGAEFPNRIINGVLKIYIKFMVSLRCKLIVQQQLDRIGIPYLSIDLGVVETENNIPSYQINELRKSLQLVGLEILENKKSILIDKIKNVIVEMIHYNEEVLRVNYSDFISNKVGYDYTYLSNIFSELEGITIQQFIIKHKIEKVKELLLYDELSLTEISHRMNYSSVCHLSFQFKKITGYTPTFFHQLKKREIKT